jgi:hypothetical protein
MGVWTPRLWKRLVLPERVQRTHLAPSIFLLSPYQVPQQGFKQPLVYASAGSSSLPTCKWQEPTVHQQTVEESTQCRHRMEGNFHTCCNTNFENVMLNEKCHIQNDCYWRTLPICCTQNSQIHRERKIVLPRGWEAIVQRVQSFSLGWMLAMHAQHCKRTEQHSIVHLTNG